MSQNKILSASIDHTYLVRGESKHVPKRSSLSCMTFSRLSSDGLFHGTFTLSTGRIARSSSPLASINLSLVFPLLLC